MSALQSELATYCVIRMDVLGVRGNARDDACLHYMKGAEDAVKIACGENSQAYREVATLRTLTIWEGFAEIEKFAADPTRQGGV